jgi:hypothetical protein
MKYNITAIVDYVHAILSELEFNFYISKDQEGSYLFDINTDTNVDANIQVIDNVGDNQEIVLYFDISVNGRKTRTFFESSTYIDDSFSKKEYEENIEYSIQEFKDEIIQLTNIINEIKSKINDIENICHNNGLKYKDFIDLFL